MSLRRCTDWIVMAAQLRAATYSAAEAMLSCLCLAFRWLLNRSKAAMSAAAAATAAVASDCKNGARMAQKSSQAYQVRYKSTCREMSTRRHNAAIGPLFSSETFADQFARSALRLSWPCFRTGFKSEWHEPTSGRGKGEAPAWRFAHVDQGKVPTSRLDFRPLGHFTDNAGHKTVSFPQNGKWVVIPSLPKDQCQWT